MKIKTAKKFGTATGIIMAILIVLVIAAISWAITCGVIKLITLCFGWTFSWAIATGIWLIMFLLRSVFSHNTTVKK